MWDRDRRRSGHCGIAWTLRLVEEGDRHAPPSSRVPMRSRYNYNVTTLLFYFAITIHFQISSGSAPDLRITPSPNIGRARGAVKTALRRVVVVVVVVVLYLSLR